MLKDNLGDSWEEACATLMCEMRMYELECLRRRMEDEVMASQQAAEVISAGSLMSPLSPVSVKSGESQAGLGWIFSVVIRASLSEGVCPS